MQPNKRLSLLYIIKHKPEDGLAHSSQRVREILENWKNNKTCDVTFICPGTKNERLSYHGISGIGFDNKKNVTTKISQIKQPYHFRLINKYSAAHIFPLLSPSRYDLIVAEELVCAPLAEKLSDMLGIPFVLIAHNFEYDLFSQMHSGFYSAPTRALLKKGESKLMSKAAAVYAFSNIDAGKIRSAYSLNNIQVTRAGVNVNEYANIKYNEDSKKIIFVGALDYYPNIEGLHWFAESIWPHTNQAYHVQVIGKNPTQDVKNLCLKMGFELVDSPPSIKPYLASARLEIVPLITGSGTRGKILEAVAARVPVISTSLGAEGLGFTNHKDIIISDVAHSFAEEINSLLGDTSKCNVLTKAAFEKAHCFDYATIAQDLLESFNTLLYTSKVS